MLLLASTDVSVYVAAVKCPLSTLLLLIVLADIFVVVGLLSLPRRLKMVPTVG